MFQHFQSSEEGTRNVVAECVGKLTLVDPQTLLPKLKVRLISLSCLFILMVYCYCIFFIFCLKFIHFFITCLSYLICFSLLLLVFSLSSLLPKFFYSTLLHLSYYNFYFVCLLVIFHMLLHFLLFFPSVFFTH